jgi:hypothetical protein
MHHSSNYSNLLAEDMFFMTRRDVRISRRDSQNPPKELMRPSCLLKHRNSLRISDYLTSLIPACVNGRHEVYTRRRDSIPSLVVNACILCH